MGENGYGKRLLEAGRLSNCGNIPVQASSAAAHSRRRARPNPVSFGFTLLELVVTLVIVSVLAVFAMSRLNTTEFDARGYFDQTQSMVRFAQKLAIARRGLIYVNFTGAFQICSTPNSTTCSCSASLSAPTGAIKSLPSGVTLGAVTPQFCFDATGRPLDTALASITSVNIVTVTSDGARTFSVEPETGYVH